MSATPSLMTLPDELLIMIFREVISGNRRVATYQSWNTQCVCEGWGGFVEASKYIGINRRLNSILRGIDSPLIKLAALAGPTSPFKVIRIHIETTEDVREAATTFQHLHRWNHVELFMLEIKRDLPRKPIMDAIYTLDWGVLKRLNANQMPTRDRAGTFMLILGCQYY